MKVSVVRKTVVEVEACDRCRVPKRKGPKPLTLTWDTPEPLLEVNQPLEEKRVTLLCKECWGIVFRALVKRVRKRKPKPALVGSACCSEPDAEEKPKRRRKKKSD